MIDLPAIAIANGAGILLMLIVLISQQKAARYGLFDERLYYAMVAFTILECFAETAAFFVDGNPQLGYRNLSLFLNVLLYITNIVFAFLWTVYADYKLFADLGRIKRVYPFVGIPAAVVIGCALANFFMPVFFTVSEQNVYSRTGLYLFPYAVTYFYLAYGVALIYANRKKVQKYLFLPAVIFMVPILIGSLLQYLFYGLSLIWLGVSIGMVSLYINVQNEASYIDALSGLFSRQYLNSYLAAQSQRSTAHGILAGVMLDIDRFKSINDTFGHQVGDEAITAAGRILHDAVGDKGFAARYAGDEFVIVQLVKNSAEIESTMQRVREETTRFNREGGRPYTLCFSMGASLYGGKKDSLDAFLKRIDEGMYTEKRRKIEEHIIPERRQ